ncbi:MFS transporter [Novosphingobium sp.]|uniref:MFS transporter n=1 Tax=Novosphingobium sp. TaxID=1874826 RepID=UPI0035B43735
MDGGTRHNARRAIVGATLGNAIEFYDFLVYSIFAIQIGQAFFPSDNAYLSLIASLATFGAGFVSRPLGAWLIGSYADRHGRRPALLLTLACMGAGIAGLALTPSYAQIGIAAPIIAVIARLLQGFALGGEVGPSTAFLIEAAAHTHRGLIGSLQRVTQLAAGGMGALVGLVLSLVLTKAELADYGWRIALGLGLVVIPYALWVRRTLPETHAVEERAAHAPPPTRREWRIMALGFVLFSAGTSTSYILNYLGTFAQASLKMGQSAALGGQFLSYVTGVIAGLGAGWLSDRVGRRPVILAAAIVPLLGAWPLFAWLIGSPTPATFTLACALFGLANGISSVFVVAVSESLSKASRARNFAMGYTLPLTIFGSTAQLIVTWAIKESGTPMAIAWYLIAIWVPGLIAALLMPETAPHRTGQAQA